ncbi:MAG: gamma-glutamyltransferase [Planctomycetota bacterium]
MLIDPRVDRRDRRDDPEAWTARSTRGVVACAHYHAAEIGASLLAAGGSAADAAVGAALALNVCEPAASGIGGMAMIVGAGFGGGEPFFLDGACTAPEAATAELVRQSHRYRGHRAVAVPGAPAALAALHQRFGRLDLREVAAPAVALARQGHRLTAMQQQLGVTYRSAVRRGNATHLIEGPDASPWEIGDLIRQPALADTIERLGRDGLMSFYRGEMAAAIDADMRAHDGFLSAADLDRVQPPEPQAPIEVAFGSRRLFTSGPPAGGINLARLAQMTTALGWLPDPRRARHLGLIGAMIQRTRQDRRRHRLTIGARDVHLAGELLELRSAELAVADLLRTHGPETGETSHLCAMDADGGVVSMTVSIERSFGSARMHPELGFLYNGYLRGFKVENQRHPHYLRPGVPARSNAAPTILLDPSGDAIAIGSTGSERMTSGIFTTLLRLERETPFEAVAAPRIHCTPEGRMLAEIDRLPETSRRHLRNLFRVTPADPWAFSFGGLQLAVRRGGEFLGVGEPRRDGGAAGPEGAGPS